MSKHKSFSVEIPHNDPKAMEEFQKAMDEYHDMMVQHVKDTAQKLGISESCASDVIYLRSRSRWTQDAEDELIRRDKAGEPRPNICEWP